MEKQLLNNIALQLNSNIPTFFLAFALLAFLLFIRRNSHFSRKRVIRIILICVGLTVFSCLDKAIGQYNSDMHHLADVGGYISTSHYAQAMDLPLSKYNSYRHFFSAMAYCLRIILMMEAYYLIDTDISSRRRIIIAIPCAIGVVLFLTSPFTHLCFYFDYINYMYHGGPLHDIIYFIACFYMLHIMYMLVKMVLLLEIPQLNNNFAL